MKKIKSSDEIPQWFDINNYNQLFDLTERALINQLAARKHVLNNLKTETNSIPQKWVTHITEQIQNADVLVDGLYRLDGCTAAYCPYGDELSSMTPELQERSLSRITKPYSDPTDVAGLKGLEVWEVELLSQVIQSENYFPPEIAEIMNNESLKPLQVQRNLDINILNKNNGLNSLLGLIVNLDIKNYRDDQIIEGVKKSLKIWREKLNFPQPSFSSFVQEKHIEKLKNFQIIPYLDLLIYANLNNILFSHNVLLDHLYKDHETIVSEEAFRQTVLKFVKKVLEPNYKFFGNEDFYL
jgi:hypothetical protein